MDSSIAVIGAGCGRTGTLSLKRALEILGYDPTYHMKDIMTNKANNNDANFWVNFANKRNGDFNEVFFPGNGVRYTASCDFPSAMYWREQLQQYPDEKVILTVRDPEKWLKSSVDTVFRVMPTSPYTNIGTQVYMWIHRKREMLYTCIVRDFLHCNWDHDHIINRFKEHNEQVIAECPKEKLLVYEVGQGWEPLCTFLEKPIPAEPFPNVNDTKEFQAIIQRVNRVGLLYLMLPVVGGGECLGCYMLGTDGGGGRATGVVGEL